MAGRFHIALRGLAIAVLLTPALGVRDAGAQVQIAPPATPDKPADKPAPPSVPPPAPSPTPGFQETKLPVHAFRVVESQSGPISYYKIVEDPAEPFIRSIYRPPLETVSLGIEVPEQLRKRTKLVRWKWRAQVLPRTGDECTLGHGDSAAIVYVTWKRGLKWYALKYVWSSVGQKGAVCDKKRNLFVVQDTIIRQSGGPVNTWVTEEIDPAVEFRKHFEGGNPRAEVPDFVGIGLMSDGDQTRSLSSADYAGFTLLH